MADGTYIALIGDLVASRAVDVAVRRDIQDRLTSAFATLLPHDVEGVAAQPLVTLGDEFQALFVADRSGARATMDLIAALVELVRPAAVRFGLGIGELTTALEFRALGMDGPCFHRARAALSHARVADFACRLESGIEPADELWSALASYALRERFGWTEAQREAIALYAKFGAWNKVADTLNVTPGAVSLRQRAAGWSHYRAAWMVLTAGLERTVSTTGDTS